MPARAPPEMLASSVDELVGACRDFQKHIKYNQRGCV
jgi:hypothetical protein